LAAQGLEEMSDEPAEASGQQSASEESPDLAQTDDEPGNEEESQPKTYNLPEDVIYDELPEGMKMLLEVVPDIYEKPDGEQRSYRELVELFRYFDCDGSGAIDGAEVGAVLRKLGQDPTEEEIQMFIEQADEDGSGEIELEEFLDVMKTASEGIFSKSELVDAFKALDTDGGGTLQADELLRMSGEDMTAKQLALLLREADEDGDGEISLDEFLAVMGIKETEPEKKLVPEDTSAADAGPDVGASA